MKLAYGVGINDATWKLAESYELPKVNGKRKRKVLWVCPYYTIWRSMLQRGYDPKFKAKHPTYENCVVCYEWLRLSNFKAWMEKQPWEGMHLDKDILVTGNKIYGPEFCRYVPQEINKLPLCGRNKGKNGSAMPMGVHFTEYTVQNGSLGNLARPYRATLSHFIKNQKIDLGRWATPEEAHKVYQKAKAETIFESIHWWITDDTVSHTFCPDVAFSLRNKAKKIMWEMENNLITSVI